MPRQDPKPTLEELLRHAEWVRRLAVRLAGPVDGDDAAQEAFLAVLRSPPRHGSNLRGFLAALVRNALRLRARGERRRQRHEAAAPASTAEGVVEAAAAAVERADLHRRLVTIVLDLDEPQRTLVLRHYFDGVDVASLAHEHRCSPDAVRAHLRRARHALRERLDAEPRDRRVLATLAQALPTAAAASLPLLLTMKTTTMLVAAGVAAAALWIAWPAANPDGPAPPHDVAVGAPPVLAAPFETPADAARREVRERHDATPTAAAPAGDGVPLRVRLRGLHPEAPWTAPVRIVLKGSDADEGQRHEASALPAVNGTLALAAPSWIARARLSRLEAEDPRYQPVALRPEQPFDPAQELVVDVQVVAVFTGRVVTADGQPVPGARVVAYGLQDGLPADGTFGQTNTSAEGTFVLQAPPAQPLAITAVPTQAKTATAGGDIPDDARIRADLLPAWVAATGGVAATNALGDLVLPQPAMITGIVRWADGPVMPEAYVNVFAGGKRTLLFGTGRGHYGITVRADGRLCPSTSVRADADGAFAIAAPAGAVMRLQAQPRSGSWNAVGGEPTRATAPQYVEVVVPRPIALRVVHGGVPVPRANVRLEAAPGFPSLGVQTNRTDEHGEMWLQLGTQHVVVAALDGARRSAARTLTPDDAGKQIDLSMDQVLAEVRVVFTGEFPVRNAQLTWMRADGTVGGSERLVRDDSSGPFRIHVEPGRWTLRVGPSDGERNGVFLLPVERAIDVPPDGFELTLPAAFGGQLHVLATNAAGVHLAGTCRLFDGSGVERPATFLVWSANHTWGSRGKPGELMVGGPNECEQVLPPGDYEALLDFGVLGARRERVTIRPREVTELRARL